MQIAGVAMSDTPGIIDFAVAAGSTEKSAPAPGRILAGDPGQAVRNLFSDGTGQFFAGFWESTPGKWQVRYTENEFCHLLAGEIRITDASGRSWVFRAGASFVVPAGFIGMWEVVEPARKVYAIFESRL